LPQGVPRRGLDDPVPPQKKAAPVPAAFGHGRPQILPGGGPGPVGKGPSIVKEPHLSAGRHASTAEDSPVSGSGCEPPSPVHRSITSRGASPTFRGEGSAFRPEGPPREAGIRLRGRGPPRPEAGPPPRDRESRLPGRTVRLPARALRFRGRRCASPGGPPASSPETSPREADGAPLAAAGGREPSILLPPLLALWPACLRGPPSIP